MKYLVQWSFAQSTFRQAVERFLQTGGVPPSGVTLLACYHGMNAKGCAVVEDADAAEVLSSVYG